MITEAVNMKVKGECNNDKIITHSKLEFEKYNKYDLYREQKFRCGCDNCEYKR